jgi:hypothetical protein
MTQEPLWYDTLADAYRGLCDALRDDRGRGGFKVVGSMLWPALPADKAGRKLADCLNPDHAQKFDWDELEALLRWGREQGIDVIPGYLANRYGYELRVVSQEEQREDLMRTIAQQQNALVEQMRRLELMATPEGHR